MSLLNIYFVIEKLYIFNNKNIDFLQLWYIIFKWKKIKLLEKNVFKVNTLNKIVIFKKIQSNIKVFISNFLDKKNLGTNKAYKRIYIIL